MNVTNTIQKKVDEIIIDVNSSLPDRKDAMDREPASFFLWGVLAFFSVGFLTGFIVSPRVDNRLLFLIVCVVICGGVILKFVRKLF